MKVNDGREQKKASIDLLAADLPSGNREKSTSFSWLMNTRAHCVYLLFAQHLAKG